MRGGTARAMLCWDNASCLDELERLFPLLQRRYALQTGSAENDLSEPVLAEFYLLAWRAAVAADPAFANDQDNENQPGARQPKTELPDAPGGWEKWLFAPDGDRPLTPAKVSQRLSVPVSPYSSRSAYQALIVHEQREALDPDLWTKTSHAYRRMLVKAAGGRTKARWGVKGIGAGLAFGALAFEFPHVAICANISTIAMGASALWASGVAATPTAQTWRRVGRATGLARHGRPGEGGSRLNYAEESPPGSDED